MYTRGPKDETLGSKVQKRVGTLSSLSRGGDGFLGAIQMAGI